MTILCVASRVLIAVGGEPLNQATSIRLVKPLVFGFAVWGNYVRRNVATNILTTDVVDTAYGFKYMGEQLRDVTIPASQGEMPPSNTTDGNDIVIPAFEDNEVYGATESGFTFWVGWNDRTSHEPVTVASNL